jgi:hypothetical protein
MLQEVCQANQIRFNSHERLRARVFIYTAYGQTEDTRGNVFYNCDPNRDQYADIYYAR